MPNLDVILYHYRDRTVNLEGRSQSNGRLPRGLVTAWFGLLPVLIRVL